MLDNPEDPDSVDAPCLAGDERSHHDASAPAPAAHSGGGGKRGARWLLVAAWSCYSWGNRMSNFAIPLLLVDAFPRNLAPAAAFVIITDLAVLAFNPYIGRAIDGGERRRTLKRAVVGDFCAAMGALGGLYLVTLAQRAQLGQLSAAAQYIGCAMFVICAAFGAVNAVMAKISYSKDWAVVVASATASSASIQDKQNSQTDLNALMQRIDLINDIIIPVAFGAIISETTDYPGLPTDTIGFLAVAGTKILLFPLQLVLLADLPSRVPELLIPKVAKVAADVAVAKKGFRAMAATAWRDQKHAWCDSHYKSHRFLFVLPFLRRIYIDQPVFLLSCGYVFLYCNVVTPGAILLALLKNSGMPDFNIGTWRGLMAGSGAVGTFLAPWLLKRRGIMASAKITITGMQISITCAAVLYILRNTLPDTDQFPTYHGLQIFLIPVTFSRMFLYAYDLVEVQKLKSNGAISLACMFSLFNTETSFTNIATLLAYGITAGVHDPSQFYILVIIGLAGVSTSTICTFLWSRRPGVDRWIELQEQGSGLVK